MSGQTTNANAQDDLRELATSVAQGLRAGTLPLRHVIGLTDEEVQAIVDAAEQLRRSGRIAEASQVYGMLIAQEPLVASYWRAMAALQQQLGAFALAVACYEVLALLSDRDAESTYREAECLARMDQRELAQEVAGIARTLARSARMAE